MDLFHEQGFDSFCHEAYSSVKGARLRLFLCITIWALSYSPLLYKRSIDYQTAIDCVKNIHAFSFVKPIADLSLENINKFAYSGLNRPPNGVPRKFTMSNNLKGDIRIIFKIVS
jgi:hypothetical protein